MRKYEPEILMGLILCMAVVMIFPPSAGIFASESTVPAPTIHLPALIDKPMSDQLRSVRLDHDGQVEQISLHDYLIGVVMSEMPMSFEPEALRAQAIASRTYALHCGKHTEADVCNESGCCQCWADKPSLSQRFGADYEQMYRKAQQAVESTDGQVLSYGGDLIDATFFACSGGMTEDAAAVWGREVPYLRAVQSPGEEAAQCYHTTAEFTPEEFADAILAEAPEAKLVGDPQTWLGETEKTPGDGAKTVCVGGAVLTGPQLRRIFNLRSTKFSLRCEQGRFCFDTYGYGHRVGLSQYGAQAMALGGTRAEQILKAYYSGVEISYV